MIQKRRTNKDRKRVEKMQLPGLCEGQKGCEEEFWHYHHVQEAHNHKLEPSTRMTRYMHTHKQMEEGISEIYNIMT
jgi:hypothetical protein